MKKTKRFVLLQLFFVLGMLNINAQTWMALEDVDYYLENLGYNVVYSCVTQGAYNGDLGAFVAGIPESGVPFPNFIQYVPDEDDPDNPYIGGPFYGLAIFAYDAYDNLCYLFDDWGLILQAHGNYISDYEDGLGFYQMQYDEYDPESYYPQGPYFKSVYYSGENLLYHIKIVVYTIE